jgi:DNA invertase Pin-like site-specific DNA recombinase
MSTSDASGIVAYLRVSTNRQKVSGLGLEAQRQEVDRYAKVSGLSVLKTFVEAESGKKCNRPELTKALAFARRMKAKLVVAKLDRLGRNLHFLSSLMESKVDFVACDNQHANTFTLHIMAAMAEYEGKLISERTKKALAVVKERGGKLGAHLPNAKKLTNEERAKGRKLGAITQRNNAIKAYMDLKPKLLDYRSKGYGRKKIASLLNSDGEVTRGRKTWCHRKVKRVLAYLDVH